MKFRTLIVMLGLSCGVQSFGDTVATQQAPMIKIESFDDVAKLPPFLAAIKNGNMGEVEAFLKKDPKLANAEITVVSRIGWTLPAVMAIFFSEFMGIQANDVKRSLVLLEIFLRYGASLNAKIPNYDPSLTWSVAHGVADKAQGYSEYLNDPAQREEYLTKVVGLLLKYGAQLTQMTDLKLSFIDHALTNAVFFSDLVFIKALANNNLVDFAKKYTFYDGKTLLDIAKQQLNQINEDLNSEFKGNKQAYKERNLHSFEENVAPVQATIDYLESRTPKAKK